jgi:hypothetical protein
MIDPKPADGRRPGMAASTRDGVARAVARRTRTRTRLHTRPAHARTINAAGIAAGIAACVMLASMVASPAAAQRADVCAKAQPGHVVVYGDVPNELAIPLAELATMERTVVNGTLHNGVAATFEGVTLRALLARAGVPEELRSGDLGRYVVVEAADGYSALFALAELDPAFRDALPILADRQDGGPIDADYGPLQVIVPGEIRHARWVRQAQCIRVGRDGMASS